MAISVVIPLYRVERYLPDLLASLDAQHPGSYRLELIFVDDGSPDRSAALVEEWLVGSRFAGRVLRQANAGVSVARNTGLDAATADWVTFPDSDDFLDPAYFRSVASFARRHDDASVLSTRLLRLREPEPEPQDIHALGFRFAAGDRVVPMTGFPDFFQLNVASAFFRVADLRRAGVRFTPGLHASEDALFTAAYLLGVEEPRLGLVAAARYIYRKRAAADSAVDRFRSEPSTYIDRFRDGYAPLMRRAAAAGGVPGWLQSMFLYECQWLLPGQLRDAEYAAVLSESDRLRVVSALAECARWVTEERLFAYDATALPLESRLVLNALAGREVPPWVGVYLNRTRRQALTFATGEGVIEIDHGDGPFQRVEAADAEYRDYFGQRVLRTISASPDGPIRRVRVDGRVRTVVRRCPFTTMGEQLDRHRRRVHGARWALAARGTDVRVWKPAPGPGGSPIARLRRVWEVETLRLHRVRGAIAARIRRR